MNSMSSMFGRRDDWQEDVDSCEYCNGTLILKQGKLIMS